MLRFEYDGTNNEGVTDRDRLADLCDLVGVPAEQVIG